MEVDHSPTHTSLGPGDTESASQLTPSVFLGSVYRDALHIPICPLFALCRGKHDGPKALLVAAGAGSSFSKQANPSCPARPRMH